MVDFLFLVFSKTHYSTFCALSINFTGLRSKKDCRIREGPKDRLNNRYFRVVGNTYFEVVAEVKSVRPLRNARSCQPLTRLRSLLQREGTRHPGNGL